MRYLEGRELDLLLHARTHDPLTAEAYPRTRLLNIFLRICEAMAYAHDHGILHRDLKPSNVMLTVADEVFVLDWGLAKDLDLSPPASGWGRHALDSRRIETCLTRHETSTRVLLSRSRGPRTLTQRIRSLLSRPDLDDLPPVPADCTLVGNVCGTPQFMSPEQCQGLKNLTPASDVYALGGILYQILTGHFPVQEGTPHEIMVRTLRGEILYRDDLAAAFHLPQALCDIVRRSLALDPAERFPSAAPLAEAIRLFLAGQPPLGPIAAWDICRDVGEGWRVEGTVPMLDPGGLLCLEGTILRCTRRSPGDLLGRVHFRAQEEGGPWEVALEVRDDEAPHSPALYEIRLESAPERDIIEILERGRRKQRRFDIRLQRERDYRLELSLEDGHLIARFDGVPCLKYAELFPQTGGSVRAVIRRGEIRVYQVELLSRGAPLRLPFLSLPDQLYRQGHYAEARGLYRQVAESHPQRPEGLMAAYKAGLCDAELQDTHNAFEAFTRLEGTMFGHCAVLGLARIGTLTDNPDWAWEALKNGYLQYRDPDVRSEFWFALLGIAESLGLESLDDKLRKYRELIQDLHPGPQEAGQVAYEFLDLVDRRLGGEELRREAVALLDAGLPQKTVDAVATLALWRHGIDADLGARIRLALKALPVETKRGPDMIRFLLLDSELRMADGQFKAAEQPLRDALGLAGTDSPDSVWAKGWMTLCLYLQGNHERIRKESEDASDYMRNPAMRQVAHLRLILAINDLAIGKIRRGRQLLKTVGKTGGVWAEAALALLEELPADCWEDVEAGPNPVTEALFLIGEGHHWLGNDDLALDYARVCDAHPSCRAFTKRLVQWRLEQRTFK
jgi:tetratricopeptide (TPR) repeat protein